MKRYCLTCGKELDKSTQVKFCCRSCSAKYNNKGISRNPNGYNAVMNSSNIDNYLSTKARHNSVLKEKLKVQKLCKNCGCVLDKKRGQRKFCSVQCRKDYNYKEYINRWKNGLEDGKRGEYQISTHIKRYFMEKYNSSCQRCGWREINEYTGKIPVELHHINGDYLNNTEENLILLCPSCHSLTENYKSCNKNGRKSRKKYYRTSTVVN